jgi:hypothetical protein
MRRSLLISIPLIFIFIVYINAQSTNSPVSDITYVSPDLINPDGKTILERIIVPEGFERIPLDENSFGFYLRNLPLKPHGTDVYLYNGQIKENKVHVAVID